jgi:hypothetical protein
MGTCGLRVNPAICFEAASFDLAGSRLNPGAQISYRGARFRATNPFTSVHTSSALELAMQRGIGNRQ